MLTRSKQPRKQRKARFVAPLHRLQHLVNVHLSKETKQKLNTKKRCIAVRKGDRVKIMAGEHKGKIGKVARVSLRDSRVYIEGITRKASKGKEAMIPHDPSKLMITDATLDDYRKKIIGRAAKAA